MITFTEAMNDAEKMVISPGCKTEVVGYFGYGRVDPNTVPDTWKKYEVRENDKGNPATIEPHVVVNYGGYFLTQDEVVMNKNGYRSLCGRGGYTFA